MSMGKEITVKGSTQGLKIDNRSTQKWLEMKYVSMELDVFVNKRIWWKMENTEGQVEVL